MKGFSKFRNLLTLPVIMITALLAAACASAPGGSGRPDWVLNPPEDADTIYGIGTMTSTNESVGWKAAENRARASISYQLTVLVEGMQTDYQTQTGAAGVTETQEFFEDINRQLTANAMGGAKIVKRGIAGKETYYALGSYSIAAVKADVQAHLESAAVKGVKMDAQAALGSLDANLSKKTKPTVVDKD
ncbi:MAG: LPP20 family lipoprotein [Treponema sp.]|jgi:hypothetical protein|nr:LPP20 family lipoprotein [Treponema sp.]